ncbi:hypothetical protein MSIMFB_00368 [Mycobacterium simulans]|uniref:Radical SAM protein n=1 Tax=Mycobacterium simulans TaxID=627089 RepID=A0A7Z7N7N7_9MYCO|nr:hypothetical protein MSIMFB_00368 [Mycobacterium simulans]
MSRFTETRHATAQSSPKGVAWGLVNQPPLVAEHDSWISVDPVLGCPATCAYCYLGRMDLRPKKPRVRVSPREVVNQLLDACAVGGDDTPICIGNYTDMFLTRENFELLCEISAAIRSALPERTLCVVTKARQADSLVSDFANFAPQRTFLFFSQSFIHERGGIFESGATADFEQTLRAVRVARHTPNVTPVHFWRPFLSKLNPVSQLEERLARLKDAGCSSSVVVGLKHSATTTYFEESMQHLFDPEADIDTSSGDEYAPPDLVAELMGAAREAQYPIFRNTSCAISHARRQFDYNGTAVGPTAQQRCREVACPATQRHVCQSHTYVPLSRSQLAKIVDVSEQHRLQLRPIEGTISIDGQVDEYVYNKLMHIANGPIAVGGVRQRKHWLGSVTGWADEP